MATYHQLASVYGTVKTTAEKLYHPYRSDIQQRDCAPLSARFDVSEFDNYRFVTILNEERLIKKFYSRLSDDAVVWDVGGHIGMWTCLLSSGLQNGRIVAFEPHPANAAAILRNAALSDLHHVDVEAVALGDETGNVQLSEDDDTSVHSIGEDGITVPMERGDVIAQDRPLPDAVKIDVEGAELECIDGMEQALSQADLVMCEVHPMHGIRINEVESRLTALGFNVEQDKHRGRPILWATR